MSGKSYSNYPYIEHDLSILLDKFDFDLTSTRWYYYHPKDFKEIQKCLNDNYSCGVLELTQKEIRERTDNVGIIAPTYYQVIDWLESQYSISIGTLYVNFVKTIGNWIYYVTYMGTNRPLPADYTGLGCESKAAALDESITYILEQLLKESEQK